MGKLKLYTTYASPPSTAARTVIKALNIPYEEIELDYMKGEFLSSDYFEKNPQRELPVLDDDGFYLSESIAIMQYLCEKYGAERGEVLYPKNPKQRAIVNHRLLFNIGTAYPAIGFYTFRELFGIVGSEEKMKNKCDRSLNILETILSRQGTKFAAGDNLTIADIALMGSIMCCYATNYDISKYPNICNWYKNMENADEIIWKCSKHCLDELTEFYKSPPSKSAFEKLDSMKKNLNK